ncbi:hypothetical protein CIT292_09282 [Citrobacter youngae ATCC 29220]|uniref:Uncharacterized protein n=1 Tax=Citrobacter youngae ATCC 29220 TaxID=500640 RepID=D4BER9_9ENTR|nr:hypothetical protein CIT292_09282 [Citrobacter youngae ATCC 29220]
MEIASQFDDQGLNFVGQIRRSRHPAWAVFIPINDSSHGIFHLVWQAIAIAFVKG